MYVRVDSACGDVRLSRRRPPLADRWFSRSSERLFPARKKRKYQLQKIKAKVSPLLFFFFSRAHSQTAERRRYKEITQRGVTASGPALAVRHEVSPPRPILTVRPALTCAPVIYAAPVSGGLFEGPRRNESVSGKRCRKAGSLPREL